MGRPRGSKNKKESCKIKLVCPVCDKTFLRFPSEIAKAQERGYNVFHCSKKCARANRKNNWKLYGKDRASYKDGGSSYRQKAIRTKGLVCERCGYNGKKYPSLIWIHHKDFNRTYNELDNLIVLCIRCHLEAHLDAV